MICYTAHVLGGLALNRELSAPEDGELRFGGDVMSQRIFQRVALAAGFLFGIFYTQQAKANVIYQVTVNTAAISGVTGNIDLQFNPGGASSQMATATISGFSSTGGTLNGSPSLTGNVSGTLPGSLVFINSTAFNDYFQGFTFGTAFQFTLTFGGPAVNSPNGTSSSGSAFGIALFDASGTTALETTDPNGFAGVANVNLNGTVTTTTFASNANGGPPAVAFAPSAAVPEPSTIATAEGAFAALLIAFAISRHHLASSE
jgi:hypothetical protein